MMSPGRRSLRILLLVIASAYTSRVTSFHTATPPAFTSTTSSSRRSQRQQQLFLVPPDVQPLAEHLDLAHQAFQHSLDAAIAHHAQHGFESTSQLLADAAGATADMVDSAKEEGGFKAAWMSYLQIFKNTLIAVHSTIDGPLRSIGWDQTWGVSIFVFTASK